jgi:hypothetical protein
MSDRRRQRFVVLATSLVLSIALAIISLPLISSQALSETRNSVSLQSSDPTPTPFSFAAGGDIGANSTTAASLDAVAGAETSFFLALGDMSYDQVTPESAWCDYVKQHVGATYPFEVLVGNHEETTAGPDGFIDNYAACLPDRLGVSGQYGHQYYFDYPPEAPLARFILIDPNVYRGATIMDYCRNGDTANCDWLRARIDEAKSRGLWTVVGMHKNCITIGIKSCSIGASLFNLLVERKVDLILQGHDHGYQRSKQLSLGTGCTTLRAYTYDPDCVVDDGTDGVYGKGAGPVLVIAANVGRSSYALDPADVEAPYFSTWMDPLLNSTGFMKFTVSRDTIDAQFVAGTGSYSDHFTIAAAGTLPPMPTAMATSVPTSTATSVAASKTFTFPAAADTYVVSSQRTSNYGTSKTLRVDLSPIAHNYLRFTVQGLVDPVISATLYVYATTSSSTGYQVGGVSDNSWTETGLTYSNAPAIGTPVGSSGAFAKSTWTKANIPAQLVKNGPVNLAIVTNNDIDMRFNSREGTKRPSLVVTTGMQAASGQVSALASAAPTVTVDSDGDGLSDADESQNGTDRAKPDSDGDGLPDLWEVEMGLNPRSGVGASGAQGDPDGDGVANRAEFNQQSNPGEDQATSSEPLYLPLINR